MNAPFTHHRGAMLSAVSPDSLIDRFVEPLGFPAPELPMIEEFHDNTRLKRYQDRSLGRRIGLYLTDPRAIAETAANRKIYAERASLPLPEPPALSMAFSDVLTGRRSRRVFSGEAMELSELSAILAAVRVNRVMASAVDQSAKLGFRPYPSGGGLYPCEIYVVVRAVAGLDPAIHHYDPHAHALTPIAAAPSLGRFSAIMSDEDGMLAGVAAVVFVTAIAERSVVKYGTRGYRFTMMEAGMIPLMLNLAAVAAGMGALNWGGFLDQEIDKMLSLDGVSETVASCLIIGKEPS